MRPSRADQWCGFLSGGPGIQYDEKKIMSDEKIDFLCDDCGEAFSAFLHDMADHNAKVTACPKCGRNHEFRPPETPSQLRGTQSIEKTRIHPTNRKSAV